MSLTVSQSVTTISPNLTAGFLGIGGVGPYTYAVLGGGAGGNIDSAGVYTAPASMNSNPALTSDIIQVTDSTPITPLVATAPILITNVLGLVCDIIQNQMGLAQGRVYLWDQKINQPTDSGLYVAVSVMRDKVFGNNKDYDSSGNCIQSTNIMQTIDIDIISRGPEARDRKEDVLLAIASDYSERQQEANSFQIGVLPAGSQFINLSNVDGAAIPYRFKISFNMQYFYKKTLAVSTFGTFNQPTVYTNP